MCVPSCGISTCVLCFGTGQQQRAIDDLALVKEVGEQGHLSDHRGVSSRITAVSLKLVFCLGSGSDTAGL